MVFYVAPMQVSGRSFGFFEAKRLPNTASEVAMSRIETELRHLGPTYDVSIAILGWPARHLEALLPIFIQVPVFKLQFGDVWGP